MWLIVWVHTEVVCDVSALNDLKNSYPVKLAIYSLENKTVDKQSFA